MLFFLLTLFHSRPKLALVTNNPKLRKLLPLRRFPQLRRRRSYAIVSFCLCVYRPIRGASSEAPAETPAEPAAGEAESKEEAVSVIFYIMRFEPYSSVEGGEKG